MNWQEVIDSPYLRDLPFKIELNEYGSIVMTPASNLHAYQQGEIASLLRQTMAGGRVLVECSVGTPMGVKVPDVAWLSDDFVSKHREETPFTAAPEICVEVISPSNSRAELEEKRQLYFDAGAREVWFCNDDGKMEFFTPASDLEASAMAPEFPSKVG